MKENTKELVEFKEWIKTMDRDELERLLCDALWKGTLDETEIYRYFLVRMSTPEPTNAEG